MTDKLEWKPVSEIPADVKTAFFHKHTQPTWMLVHKDNKGVWRASIGMITAEVIDPETYFYIPTSVIPPLPPVTT